jgi:hypothetical protein
MKLPIRVQSSMTPEDEIKELDQMINDRNALIQSLANFIDLNKQVLRWEGLFETLTPEQHKLLKNILEDK